MKHPVRLLAISLSVVSLIGPFKKAEATDSSPSVNASSSSTTMQSPVSAKVEALSYADMHPELVTQLKSKKGGSIAFWESVSWCETNHNWENSGYYAGGLGIAQSAWKGYGGWEFARTPKKATKQEQIIVGNRIAFFGFQTRDTFITLDDKLNNKPFFRPAQGWKNMTKWGKGCANWKTRKPARARYTEAGMAEWLKTRPVAEVKPTGKSSKVSSQSLRLTAEVKSCPQWEAKLKAQGLVPVKKFSYIMWRESRCQEKVVSKPNSNGTRDYGLLQINSSWRTVTKNVCGGTNLNVLLNSKCNLKVAKYLFDNGGIGHWSATSGVRN